MCPEICPEDAVSFVIDFFEQLDFSARIETIFMDPYGESFVHLRKKNERSPLNMSEFDSLQKQADMSRMVSLSQFEIDRLSPGWNDPVSAFPITFQRQFYGYFLFFTKKGQPLPLAQTELVYLACFLLGTYFSEW